MSSIPRSAPLHCTAPLCSTSLLEHDIMLPPPNCPPPPPSQCLLSLPSWAQQARQGELIRRQEEAMDRGRPLAFRNSHDVGPSRRRRSCSRSPYRRKSNFRRRSSSPEVKRVPFRTHAAGPSRRDKLPACPVCLGRHRHRVASCQATKTWNG